MYAQKIEGDSWRGEKIDKGKIDKMSGTIQHIHEGRTVLIEVADQQLGQLHELMQAIQKMDHSEDEQA